MPNGKVPTPLEAVDTVADLANQVGQTSRTRSSGLHFEWSATP